MYFLCLCASALCALLCLLVFYYGGGNVIEYLVRVWFFVSGGCEIVVVAGSTKCRAGPIFFSTECRKILGGAGYSGLR